MLADRPTDTLALLRWLDGKANRYYGGREGFDRAEAEGAIRWVAGACVMTDVGRAMLDSASVEGGTSAVAP